MGKLVSVSFTKGSPKPPVRRPAARPRRRKKPSLGTLIWSIVLLALTITFLIIQGSLLMIAVLVSGLITLLSAANDFKGDGPVPATPAPKAKTTIPRGKAASGRSARKPGTGGRKRTCSARCRASVKDKATCSCVCGGRTHGIKAGNATAPAKPTAPVGERMRKQA